MSKHLTVMADAQEHDRGFHAAFAAVKEARKLVPVRPHRAITPLHVTPFLAAQAILIPILLCSLLVWYGPELLAFWRETIVLWSDSLGLQFVLASQPNKDGVQLLALAGTTGALVDRPLPSDATLLLTAFFTVAGLVLSLRMSDAKLPLKYPLRIVCVVQLVTLIYFWWSPNTFPYNIVRHSEELMSIGYAIMLATPVMLGIGYYILRQRLWIKLFNTALILGFFAVLVPHQVLAQSFLIQNGSVLFMPVLYICFGAVFDAFVFVALYSWVVSNSPKEATI